jgi:hypothetical protein
MFAKITPSAQNKGSRLKRGMIISGVWIEKKAV